MFKPELHSYASIAALTLLLAGTAAAATEATGAQPVPVMEGFHAEFEARYLGFSAEALLDLRPGPEPGEYIYEVVSQARGLAKLIRSGTGRETSWFSFGESGIQPARYLLDDGTEEVENDTDIKFDWDNMVAHSVYKGEAKDIELVEGMLDRLSADVAVIQDLRDGIEPGGYQLTDRNSVRTYEFTMLGEETISVPAGEYKTVKYRRQRPGSTRAAIIWYAPELNYLPVMIEQQKRGKKQVVLKATKLERTL